MHARPAPAPEYLPFVAVDVAEAGTGVHAIDEAVRTLYRTGYLHNHARMWLASYLVHLRKIDWRAGARWMYAHLLDGDLASNTLSWQWVAGTWTGRPYLFDDGNVRPHAPDWAQPGGPLDRDYDELAAIATTRRVLAAPTETGGDRVAEPPVFPVPPGESPVHAATPVTLARLGPLGDGPIVLRHPWSLGARPAVPGRRIGMLVSDFHAEFPWSAGRWAFVLQAMAGATDAIVLASRAEWRDWLHARRHPVCALATLNPGYADVLDPRRITVVPVESPFAEPDRLCRSFSAYWKAVTASEGAA
jgi:deoxyribodipyrimidine photo-lyase